MYMLERWPDFWKELLVSGAVCCAFVTAEQPASQERGRLQTLVPAESSVTQDSSAVSPLVMLPVNRWLGHPPAVGSVGILRAADGSLVRMPVTAALAEYDLRKYAEQLETLFPKDAPHYPADSLRQLQVARASAWITLLREMNGPGVSGRQQLSLATVAMRAAQDTLAKRLITTRMAEVVTLPVERAMTLRVGLELMTDPSQGPERIVNNFATAEEYAKQLLAIRETDTRRIVDRTSIRQWREDAAATMLETAVDLQRPELVASHATRLLDLLLTLPFRQRYDNVRQFPYWSVASVLMTAPRGRAYIDTLNAHLFAVAQPRESEWPNDIPLANRPAAREELRQSIRELFAAFELIGKPAPPITAHAWLNTADSAYAPTPRTHPLNDGIIRVLVFGNKDNEALPALERVQEKFSRDKRGGVQVLLTTETEGHVGPDLKSPADEVASLKTHYADTRRITFPIALWAGAKETKEYEWQQPVRSPVPSRYPISAMRGACVVVDGQGIVRAYYTIDPRKDDTQLMHLLTTLRDAASHESGVTPSSQPPRQ